MLVTFSWEEIRINYIRIITFEWICFLKHFNRNEGGGEYRILQGGKIFEKVGVNFSEVFGTFSKQFRNIYLNSNYYDKKISKINNDNSKTNSNFLNKSIKIIGKNKIMNSFFKKFADSGIRT